MPAGGMSGLVAGLDLGGSTLKAGLFDAAGQLLHQETAATPAGSGPQAIVDTISAAIVSLQRRLADNSIAAGTIRAVGVGSPGLIDDSGRVHGPAVNLLGWQGTSLSEMVTSRCGIACVAGNDVNFAALAEARHRACDNLVFIALGTGIGGGIVSGGTLISGNLGMAGEIGHVVVEPGGRPCGCGQRGCVEQYAGSRAIADETALQSAALMLARAIGYLLSIVAPELVVIGGGNVERFPQLIERVSAALQNESFGYIRERTLVQPSQLGYRAGMIGAAIAAREALAAPKPAAPGTPHTGSTQEK